MGEGSEVVFGEIPVVSRLALGSERLKLFLTDSRILVAHIGKRGAGAVTGTSLLGRLSEALEDLLKSGKESLSKRKLSSLSPRQILSASRDNFFIRYDEVVNVDVRGTPNFTRMTVLTGEEKFEFSTSLSVETVVGLLERNLDARLTVRRLE